jgi:hypothetical protein
MKKFVLFLSVLSLISTNLLAEDNMAEKIKFQNNEVVKLASKEISKQLPQKVDKYTNLVKIVGKDEALLYTFEIDTGSKSDDTVIKEDKSRMKKAVTKGICTSSIRFLKSGINISYIYASSKSKKELFRFDVSMKDCKK